VIKSIRPVQTEILQGSACWPLLRTLGVAAVAAVLSGCVETQPNYVPDFKVPAGGSAVEVAEEIATNLGRARVIDKFCKTYGINKIYPNSNDVVGRLATDLAARGYSKEELQQIGKRFDSSYSSAVYSTWPDSGESLAELCNGALREIEQGTELGKLLRLRK
jgi:hypothetical protein